MGCAASRIDKDERVQICRRRKKLMKQLLEFRRQFADVQWAYLKALKNTGATLRQFTESESLELENTPPRGLTLPPLPPPPLPPSPPPAPLYSPEIQKVDDDKKNKTTREEIIEINENGSRTPAPLSFPTWDNRDPFVVSSPEMRRRRIETLGYIEEEDWAETKTEFEEDDWEDEAVSNRLWDKSLQPVELVDDNSSTMSYNTKDSKDMAMVVWRSKKTLNDIIKELDDYFLKASAGGKEIAVLMDINKGDTFLHHNFKENKRNRSNSTKFFSLLSWSWSSKSLEHKPGAAAMHGSIESRGTEAHCITLAKLYAAEQRLYKEVKEEERTKLEQQKKSMLLQKQEKEKNQDGTKIDKTRLSVENLETDIRHLQHSINETRSSILSLIDEELYPQLVALISGLMHMWRLLYECHQVQNHISKRLNHIADNQGVDFTTDYHHHATVQLETEVTSCYISFCKLTKYQRDYVRTLSGWIQLTACLVDDHQQSNCLSAIRKLCENWQLVFDKLPDKVASEAIKSFLSAIHSIFLYQIEERNLRKKSDKLEKRLQKELKSMAEMEKKVEGSFPKGVGRPELSPKHPLTLKIAKVEALKKREETEKTKYQNSVQVTKAMTLSNLKTSLPNVFQALMGFSDASAKAFEALHSRIILVSTANTSEDQN